MGGGACGSKGEQVTELNEDTVLANLTSDSPLVNNEETRQPAFNSEQLEACDDCDTEDRLQWFGGGEDSVASLEGRQHLLTLPSDASSAPQLCTRHDVDGLVWRLAGGETAEHAATFPALGYVQASKQSRKFLAAPASARFSVICDSSRHLYLYRQPEAHAAELGLRNRESGETASDHSRAHGGGAGLDCHGGGHPCPHTYCSHLPYHRLTCVQIPHFGPFPQTCDFCQT